MASAKKIQEAREAFEFHKKEKDRQEAAGEFSPAQAENVIRARWKMQEAEGKPSTHMGYGGPYESPKPSPRWKCPNCGGNCPYPGCDPNQG